jgi:hypothetical protein
MSDAFAEAIILFDDKISKFEPRDGPLDKSFSDLDWFPRSYWQMRTATNKSEEMLEGLRDLQVIFKDIWPWSLCYHAQTALREVTDNAVYTWEQALLKQSSDSKPSRETMDALKGEIMEKFRVDAAIATKEFSAKVCLSISFSFSMQGIFTFRAGYETYPPSSFRDSSQPRLQTHN